MEHTKHLWRAVIILLLLAAGGVIARHFLIPPSFGVAGPYRYAALEELMDKAPVHGSVTSCQSCHQEIFETHAAGKHSTVRCEVCHAPLNAPLNAEGTTHVKGQEKTAEMPSDRSVELCKDCHQQLTAKPQDMPQVDIAEHLKALEVSPEDGKVQDGLCITCHDVHDPSL